MAEEKNIITTTEQTQTEVTETSTKSSKAAAYAFRQTATEEQLKELAKYLESQKAPSKALPCPKKGWDFSYAFAAGLLRDRGIWEPLPEKADEPTIKPFVLDALTKGCAYTTRSIQFSKDINDRLNDFVSTKEGYQSKAIITQIIAAGLEVYGG